MTFAWTLLSPQSEVMLALVELYKEFGLKDIA
jgi:hypothetical protein